MQVARGGFAVEVRFSRVFFLGQRFRYPEVPRQSMSTMGAMAWGLP